MWGQHVCTMAEIFEHWWWWAFSITTKLVLKRIRPIRRKFWQSHLLCIFTSGCEHSSSLFIVHFVFILKLMKKGTFWIMNSKIPVRIISNQMNEPKDHKYILLKLSNVHGHNCDYFKRPGEFHGEKHSPPWNTLFLKKIWFL